ncbi:synaptotagmin-like protein 5 isoform X2 [Erpetoichthys calabaricus]|uniref:Synaptotagmin-like protein 5 n=1 Tax=Erpetoichthys calabaricus TaxID=27687 RepID=A0A8C4X2Z1_ERPCA|nr:synaptotagmin-like protein 5 isoform X2 [Erpetoichthys calabaricus]
MDKSEILNLSFLNEPEKQLILDVLQKNDKIRKHEEKRIRRLKNELLEIRRKGLSRRQQITSNKVCVRCQKRLGLIFDRGDLCEYCHFRVCNACRVVISEKKWKCMICAKVSELKVASGEWFYEVRSRRYTLANVFGCDVVKQSIMRTPADSGPAEQNPLKPAEAQQAQNTSAPGTPKSTRSAIRSVLDVPRKKGKVKSTNKNENALEKPDDTRSIGAASDLDTQSVRSGQSASRSTRGSIFAVDPSGVQGVPNNMRPTPSPGRSATPSIRSSASGTSRRADGAESGINFPANESNFGKMSNKPYRHPAGPPSIAVSRTSLSSDRSKSEIDLTGPHGENDDTLSVRSRSVPGDLNEPLEDLEEVEREDDIEEMAGRRSVTHRSSLSSGLSMTSLNSMMSVYSETGDYGNVNVSGEILLNISYSYKTGALNVLVKQCRNLAIADEKKQRTDPYVKAYLLPDKSRQSKRKTKIKVNTTDPVYNETLKYVISHSQLETRTLQLSVWHNDRFGRNAFLGEVEIPFDSWQFENQTEEWFALQPKADALTDACLQYKGELTVALRYVPPEKNLTLPLEQFPTKKSFIRRKKGNSPLPKGGLVEVVIKEAKNLTAVKSGGTSDSFVKGYLLPDNNKSSKHKTPVIKKSVNPQWNHTFTYSGLQPNDLQNVCLELTVWDKESLSSNVFLGGVRLGMGTGLSYGNEVDWMDSDGEELLLWQHMIENPEVSVEGTLMLRASMAKRKL